MGRHGDSCRRGRPRRWEIARALATSFGSAYAYDNVLYLVAGKLIEAVSGETWEDFVVKRIIDSVYSKKAVMKRSIGALFRIDDGVRPSHI